ncbi:MAG: hypothetical protein DYG88_09920 [Chloroflexi bacterium CFX4]|nr:hypothetical protein [Chloroflexi bacterium CFX4]MDL1923725.1 XisI protein [Chloroflexi bacterium CFX3]
MDQLADVVQQIVLSYAGGGLDLRAYPLANEAQGVYAVAIVDYPVHKRPASFAILVRLENDKVIVEEDLTDRPIVDALVRAGIPRTNIVLAYAGESIPTEQT